jgi:5-methylcytosine-specific restriction protein B
MRFYFKRTSEQDKTKTSVINEKASEFFNVDDFTVRDQERNILVRYPSNTELVDVRIVQKQDKRIFINRDLFNAEDIWVFEKIGENEYTFDVIKPESPHYAIVNSALRSKFLITDNDPRIQFVNQENHLNMPLNTILFGPPGTGKTDSTVEKALEILEMSSKESEEKKRREENRETFRSLLNKKIFFVTMHPSYSYEDFVQGIKPSISDSKELLFEPKNGIFKEVSEKAKLLYHKCKLKRDPQLRADFDTLFKYTFDPLLTGEVSFIEIPRQDTPFKIIDINNRRLKFETSTGVSGPTYNISRETLKRIYEKGTNDIILSGNSTYYNYLLDFLNSKAKELGNGNSTIDNETHECQNINFVLILDEINRANISKVFGELITLLEEDKRISKSNEMSVTLPSGESFSVPPNLYILGTMNTADKSIALVDIALRRRFQFIPKYPDPEVISNFCLSADRDEKRSFMEAINKKLRKEKGVDFQIGHAYFLKNNTLGEVINENIIPLLVEYLRNDLEKVKKLMAELGKPVDKDYYENTGLLKYVG